MYFYKSNDILPDNFSINFSFSRRCLVAIQSAEAFYESMIHERKRSIKNYKESKPNSIRRNNNLNQVCSLPYSVLNLRPIDVSKQHIPNSHEFVVYLVKKDGNSRILRLYQCRCDIHHQTTEQDRCINNKPGSN